MTELWDIKHTSVHEILFLHLFFFQAEDGIRYWSVTGVQTCALPIFLFPWQGFLQNTDEFRPGVEDAGELEIACKVSVLEEALPRKEEHPKEHAPAEGGGDLGDADESAHQHDLDDQQEHYREDDDEDDPEEIGQGGEVTEDGGGERLVAEAGQGLR